MRKSGSFFWMGVGALYLTTLLVLLMLLTR